MKTCYCVLVSAFVIATMVGCGGGPDDYPDMGTVSGTVTMDGSPVTGASITFTPVDKSNRPSFGYTDEDGYYELKYSSSRDGAKVGEHTVSISTHIPPAPDEEGILQPAQPETIPNKYNSQSELKKTVESGSQTFDFELSSDGEIDKHEEDADVTDGDF